MMRGLRRGTRTARREVSDTSSVIGNAPVAVTISQTNRHVQDELNLTGQPLTMWCMTTLLTPSPRLLILLTLARTG